MPTVHRIGSIKIDIYSRDHLPPHFHAIYGDDEALISIKTLEILKGDIPQAQLRKIQKWAGDSSIRTILIENYYRLNPRIKR